MRFGVVKSLNTTIKAVLRRARGMRGDAMLLPKLKWARHGPLDRRRTLLTFSNLKRCTQIGEDRKYFGRSGLVLV